MDIRGRNKINPNFNMSSMTDIVFLLLIFFMITSTLVTTSALDILLPKASGKTENKKSISVSITKNLVYYIDSKIIDEISSDTGGATAVTYAVPGRPK
jgi:biopolymer transport protein ExbD